MPSGDRRGHEHAPEAVGLRERRAPAGIVIGEVHARLRLAVQAQAPPRAAAHEHRRLAALRERGQQRLGPEVLVDVDRGVQQRDAVQ